eukprot:4121205-Alexandrium_andersonii.AAC.1
MQIEVPCSTDWPWADCGLHVWHPALSRCQVTGEGLRRGLRPCRSCRMAPIGQISPVPSVSDPRPDLDPQPSFIDPAHRECQLITESSRVQGPKASKGRLWTERAASAK